MCLIGLMGNSCSSGKAGEFIDRGDNTYGGKYVINPSGGLISKGHPLGATGLAQCAELCWQLRGQAGKRQVSTVCIHWGDWLKFVNRYLSSVCFTKSWYF